MSWRCSSRCPGCRCSAGLWYVAWIWRECYDWYGDWLLMMDIGYSMWLPMITDDYWWLQYRWLIIDCDDSSFIWPLHMKFKKKEIRTCSRASTFWLRFSWRSKLWSQKHLASTGHLAWMYLMDSRIASLYPAMMVSEFEDWDSMGKRTVDMSSTETRLKYVEMLIGIRTVGWMLFFTSSLARFNLGKCVIRGLRCGQSLAQIGPMQFRCDDHDRSGSITHFSVLHAQRNKTKVGNDMKWHEMTWNDMKWLVSKSNGRMECSYFKGSESHRITWLSWFIPVCRICRIYLSVPADFQSLGFDLLKICTVRSWQK